MDVQPNATGEQGNAVLGVLLALGSAFGYAVIALCSRALAGRYHPLQSLTIGFGTGAVILLPFALFNGLVVSYPASGWSILLYLGLVPTVLAYVLFLSGMRHTTATLASITTLLEPLTSTLLAWLFFKEQLGFFGLLGGMLLVGAILLLFRNDSSKNS
jgi:DME family drug/metabolite transporter